MISSGLIIFAGLLLLFYKMRVRQRLVWLGRPLLVDLGVSAAAYILHYGTFSGVMAAAVAGLACSVFTSQARKHYGYIHIVDGCEEYVPGARIQYDPKTLVKGYNPAKAEIKGVKL